MAKRKRLTLPPLGGFAPGPTSASEASPAPAPASASALGPGLAPAPISRVTGEAAATAALREVAEELGAARSEGRLVLRLELDRIEEGWLVRDRIGLEAEELASLMTSLSAHGQRSPIEVTDMGEGRFGLISGWRRVTALRRLHAETGEERFATVLALLRRPDTAAAAYVAMVEENEIRAGLSYFERARIAAKAVEAGVFATDKLALQQLYGSASRAKRSKIGSFLGIYRALEGALRYPSALPERLGLALARRLEEEAAFAAEVAAALAAATPDSAEAELALIADLLAPAAEAAPELARPSAPDPVPEAPAPAPAPDPAPANPRSARAQAPAAELRPGLFLKAEGAGSLHLYGPAVDEAFRARLRDWLASEE
ncbi:ParB/RepB/Spo0J family partition protein [Cereibacter sphaeroides]|uniref:ParB/RepB/Spo0J family partition protein n=1 Tax=Cereibacter sphaeroides TaxID=1063 RepID=UPI000191CE52|nr:ParB N-terminal domain-containing protein [Cereibacter sphaeroides]ACM04405.1 ParB-like nuclease [Cereibacter sphaeroides KD131]